MELWLIAAALPFATGLFSTRWYTVLLWPAAALLWGVLSVLGEPLNYDMPGAGLYVGVIAAVVAMFAWLAGFVLRGLLGRED